MGILFLAAVAHCGVIPDDPCYREDTNCYEKGVNLVGNVPYLPEIWACELACKDTSGQLVHLVSARWIPHVLSVGQLQPSFQRQGWCLRKGGRMLTRHDSDKKSNMEANWP